MKFTRVLSILLFVAPLSADAQVGINATGNPPHQSAMLDVESTSHGFLVPRMTTAQRDQIIDPLPGLQIFNSETRCIEFYTGEDGWYNVCDIVKCVNFKALITSVSNEVCLGQGGGVAVVTPQGGKSPYTYSWQGGGTDSTYSELAAGTYSVTVHDANACEVMVTATVDQGVPVPDGPAPASHLAALNQVTWKWLSVVAADGYKYSTTNDYSTATDNGADTTFTQTGLDCGTNYTLYVWAYNTCSESDVLVLEEETNECPFVCGDVLSHGFVSGVTPSSASQYTNRSYPTVTADWTGSGGKCWTGRNLGATDQPLSADDDEDTDRTGWYFQFNRKQGYFRHESSTTPSWSITSISEDANWQAVNDPCRTLFGEEWRVPTMSEWLVYAESVNNSAETFSSVLNLHTAGVLNAASGLLNTLRPRGRYWSNEQTTATTARYLSFGPLFVDGNASLNKASAASVRCVMD